MKNVLKYQLPPLLWIVTAFILAYGSDRDSVIKLPPGADKIFHAGIYFILCWLVQRAFYHQEAFPQLKRSSFLGAFIFCCVYAILDEFHQDFLPSRSSDTYNIVAGVGGALLYTAIAWIVSRRRNGEGTEPKG